MSTRKEQLRRVWKEERENIELGLNCIEEFIRQGHKKEFHAGELESIAQSIRIALDNLDEAVDK